MIGETKIEMFVELAIDKAQLERARLENSDGMRLLYDGRLEALKEVYQFLHAKDSSS